MVINLLTDNVPDIYVLLIFRSPEISTFLSNVDELWTEIDELIFIESLKYDLLPTLNVLFKTVLDITLNVFTTAWSPTLNVLVNIVALPTLNVLFNIVALLTLNVLFNIVALLTLNILFNIVVLLDVVDFDYGSWHFLQSVRYGMVC